jgi:two-component sensor histidine kinase
MIDLTWRIEKSDSMSSLALEWSDDQKVATHARGTGFGSKLKRALVEQKWKGTMSVDAEGPYRFSCSIPLPEAKQSQDEFSDIIEPLVTETNSID